MKEISINAYQAQGLLNHNPVIKTQKKSYSDERVAVFQPDYKAMLTQANTSSRKKGTLRQQIEERAHSILAEAPGKRMPMASLIHELHQQLDCPESTLYAALPNISSIERIEVSGSRTKICRAKDIQRGTAIGTLRQRISESVLHILESTPDKQMSLSELIKCLQKEYNCPKSTLYQYIAGIDNILRLDVPNTSTKLCRMKDIQKESLLPQIQNIANPILKKKVERTLPFLTEENVDIGLFLLSKEFEITLKTYLIQASTKSKLPILPPSKGPDKWNLNGMVDCAKENGIITDLATFHYLRQTRNDRAHGTMPSLAERQLLMKYVQYIAGLYVDYIKLLDDLSGIYEENVNEYNLQREAKREYDL